LAKLAAQEYHSEVETSAVAIDKELNKRL
jgi:hypothetical protein